MGYLIDFAFTLVAGSVLARVASPVLGVERTVNFTVGAFMIANLPQWYLVTLRGQSLGKILVGTRIVRTDGSPAGFLHGVLLRSGFLYVVALVPRFVLPALSPLSGLVNLVDTLMVFTTFHRTLHDHVAGTCVVEAPRGW